MWQERQERREKQKMIRRDRRDKRKENVTNTETTGKTESRKSETAVGTAKDGCFLMGKTPKPVKQMCLLMAAAFFVCCMVSVPAYASSTAGVTKAFDVVYDIVAAIISSIGQLLLLWGVFEWASALNSQDGIMQSMAFRRIAAGLVTCLTPHLIPVITSRI